MEGTTEPILTILGHPIAGNPSQFAIERALHDMNLEWRVLSFDVPEADIPAALDGLEVLGIRGVLVDSSVSRAVAKWYAAKYPQQDEASIAIDCLYRDRDGLLRGSCELGDWFTLAEVAKTADGSTPLEADSPQVTHGASRADLAADQAITEAMEIAAESLPPTEVKTESSVTVAEAAWIWLGDDTAGESPSRAVPRYERLDLPPDPRRVLQADFIVLAETGEVDAEDWPADDGSTVVIDLTEGHPERDRLEELGYRFVDEFERRSATLSGGLRRWTGRQAPHGVICDAIEEYLGV
ncbi:hypothetical protein N9D23_11360 [Rubripirellula sp.]|jgi:hypothetical protein|nr:hypothetical protein [Rubripirellula sp.]MDF1840329.1 hypothetical protein [Rubripirellula sp.]